MDIIKISFMVSSLFINKQQQQRARVIVVAVVKIGQVTKISYVVIKISVGNITRKLNTLGLNFARHKFAFQSSNKFSLAHRFTLGFFTAFSVDEGIKERSHFSALCRSHITV